MLISVVMPVYNSEKYLKKSIESVLNQTFKDWELIVVDDGSTDMSWELIVDFSKKDERIKPIRQENQGPGIARNTGINHSQGEYVVFIDSDDYVDPEYFYLLSQKKGADIIFIDVAQVNSAGIKIKDEKMSQYKNYTKNSILRSMMTGKIPWGGVRKVVKRSMLNDNQIRYSDTKIGEEALFSFSSLLRAEKVSFLDSRTVYMYAVRENSQSSLKIDDPWGPIVMKYKDYLLSNNLYSIYANTLNAFIVSAAVVSIDRLTQIYKGKELHEKVKQRMQKCNDDYDCNYGLDSSNMDNKARIFVPCIKAEIGLPVMLASRLKQLFK